MIRHAAETGADRLSWTPGEAQAARYDLSKTLKSVVYSKNPDGTYYLSGDSVNGPSHTFGGNIPKDKLPDFVGKELAEKIIKEEGKSKDRYDREGLKELSGVDLKVGGEGMKGFYDKMIPAALEKIGKEHGVKVKTYEPKKVEASPEEINKLAKTLYETFDRKGGEPSWEKLHVNKQQHYINTAKEKSYLADNPEHKVHYIDIPQSLKDAALHKGFPLFSGKYMFTPVDGDPFKQDKK